MADKNLSRRSVRDLPYELVELILSRVPVATILTCRCVCKHWNRQLRSGYFRLLHATASPRSSWILTFSSGPNVAAYSPIPRLPTYNLFAGVKIASSRGLLAFCCRYSFLVCNPLIPAMQILPAMQSISVKLMVGMIAFDGFYEILVMGFATFRPQETLTELYNSQLGRWVVHSRTNESYIAVNYGQRLVWFAGYFHFLADRPALHQPYRLMRYHRVRGRWQEMAMRMPPEIRSRRLMGHSLVRCGERLMLVALFFRGATFVHRGGGPSEVPTVGVWEADWGRKEWVVVSYMPRAFVTEARWDSLNAMQCVGSGHLLWFSIRKALRSPPWIQESMMFNLLNGRWEWLPGNGVWGQDYGWSLGADNNVVALLLEPNLVLP